MQRARYPCRQLNSKTIRSAALGYLSPVFLGKCSIISAKCVCKIDEEGIENAWKYVCRTRDLCDRKLKGLLLTVFHYFKQVSTSLGCSKSIDQDLSISFVGVKNVAFFFSSISTQSLKEKRGKRNVKDKEDDEESDDADQLLQSSQLANSTSKQWIDSHPTIVNQKLCPSLNYWIALTTPNGAPSSALVIHRAFLECNVDIIANQVTTITITITTLFTIIRLI